MRLHEIKGVKVKRTQVGIGAICIVTGRSYSAVCDIVRREYSHTNRIPAHVDYIVVKRTLTGLGYRLAEVPIALAPTQAVLKAIDPDHKAEKPSLAAWLPLRTKSERESMLLVRLSNGGVVVVLNQRAAHAWSKGSVALCDLSWRRAKVISVFAVTDQRKEKAEREAARAAMPRSRAKHYTVNDMAHSRERIAAAKALEAEKAEREKLRRKRAASMIKPRAILLAKRQDLVLVEHADRIDCAALGRSFDDWSEALAALTEHGSAAKRAEFASGGYSWEKTKTPQGACAA